MVAINFAGQFATDVEKKIKRQTIRAKARCVPGDALQLYTGQRTARCRKLRNAICSAVIPVSIYEEYVVVHGNKIDDKNELEKFAQADGFKTFRDLVGWFSVTDQGLPFYGLMIKWE